MLLGGCDILYGVMRRAPLESMPSLSCVSTVIASAPGVVTLRMNIDSGGTAITLSGFKSPASTSYNFAYRGADSSHIIGMLQIELNHAGVATFSDSLLGLNWIPPQEQIDATRPVMKYIEEHLAHDCGIAQLPARINEHCHGVKCPVL